MRRKREFEHEEITSESTHNAHWALIFKNGKWGMVLYRYRPDGFSLYASYKITEARVATSHGYSPAVFGLE